LHKRYAKKFEESHPLIRIDWEPGAYATQHDKLVAALAAGVGPDAYEIGAEWIGELEGMEAILPLDDMFNDWPGRYDIYPRVIEQFRYKKGFPGKVGPLYALPFILVAHYMYYRIDWAEEVGFTGSHPSGGPGTMDEFLQLAQLVTDPKKPRYGFAMRGARGGTGMWFEAAGSMGMKMWDWTVPDEEWRFALDTEKSIAAHTWYAELFTKQQICPPSAPTDSFAEVVGNMKSGLTCMTFHHMQTINMIGDVIGLENLGVVPVPKGPDPNDWTVFGGAAGNAVNANTPEKEAAFEWIAFIASPDFQDDWCKGTGGVPYNMSIANDPFYQENRFVKATLEGAPAWDVFPTTRGMGEFDATKWPTLMQECLTGVITPEQMMKDLNEFLEGAK
jgi:multiple sugar transport system substrate-binding protein